MKESAVDAWPIADGDGLLAMVRSGDLEQAVDDGASNQIVAQILGEDFQSGPTTAEDIPHLHPDHSLSLALERMGTSGLNVLPVVSRANLRQLIGIIALDDILNAYGVTKRADSMERGE
jgi:CBS domain-containing protein